MPYKLTAEAVTDLYNKCRSETAPEIEGIVHSARLDTKGHEDRIREMLAELPPEFQSTGGGGWSFLNACNRGDGSQWADLHATMEKLFMLGIAAGLARWQMPRDMWDMLPGSMPYVSVL